MQSGYLSLLYSIADKPLEYWSKQKSKSGSIHRVIDKELNERVLEIQDLEDASFQKTWIMCPPQPDQILNIRLPILVMVLKSLQSQMLIQLQVLDRDNVRHLINLSNLEHKRKNSESRAGPIRTHLLLEPGWNKLEIDLAQLCKLLGGQFRALTRLKICANCRLRRIYFLDRRYDDCELSQALYQGFLDLYMSKWGIKTIERSTQTKKTAAKFAKEGFALPVHSFARLFLKNLQSKSDRTLDEHLSKHSVISLKEYLDFKRRAKFKSYVIPEKNRFKCKRNSESSLVDLNEIRKYFGRENNVYDKLIFEDNKSTDSDKNSKRDAKNLLYKVYRYKYPVIMDKKTSDTKNETSKYPFVNK